MCVPGFIFLHVHQVAQNLQLHFLLFFSFFLLIFLKFIFERESTSEGGTEREGDGGSQAGSALTARSPGTGLELTSRGIMTGAEDRRPDDRATPEFLLWLLWVLTKSVLLFLSSSSYGTCFRISGIFIPVVENVLSDSPKVCITSESGRSDSLAQRRVVSLLF